MKRIIKICCILGLFWQAGSSQNAISLGVNFGTSRHYAEIIESNAVDFLEESLENKISYNIGFQVQFNPVKGIFLRSGVLYSESNFEHKLLGILDEGNPWNNQAWRTEKNISVKSIDIPFEFGYYLPNNSKNMNFYVGVSGSLNSNIENKSTGIFYQEGMPNHEFDEVENEITKSRYSIGIFTGLEINILDKVVLGIEPKMEYNEKDFTLFLFESKALSQVQLGLTLRIRTK